MEATSRDLYHQSWQTFEYPWGAMSATHSEQSLFWGRLVSFNAPQDLRCHWSSTRKGTMFLRSVTRQKYCDDYISPLFTLDEIDCVLPGEYLCFVLSIPTAGIQSQTLCFLHLSPTRMESSTWACTSNSVRADSIYSL